MAEILQIPSTPWAKEWLKPSPIPILICGFPSIKSMLVARAIGNCPNFDLLTTGMRSEQNGADEIEIDKKRIYLTSVVPYQTLIYHPGSVVAVNLNDPGMERLPKLVRAKIPSIVEQKDVDQDKLVDLVTTSEINVAIIPDDMDYAEVVAAAADLLNRVRTSVRGDVFLMSRHVDTNAR